MVVLLFIILIHERHRYTVIMIISDDDFGVPEEEIDIPRSLVSQKILCTHGTQNSVKCSEKKVKEKEKNKLE